MKEFYNLYLNDQLNPQKKNFFALMCGLAVCGGIYGMFYETVFYFINNGGLCRRGSCFGPWIDIYGFDSLLIYAMCHKFKKKPITVFCVSGIVCGAFEYVVGWAIFTFQNGRRCWDYNTEIWNWGNLGGFVCLRSVLVFAISGLLLMYLVCPLLIWIQKKIKKPFYVVCVVLGMLFLADELYNYMVSPIFHTYNSKDLYTQIGRYDYYNEEKLK